MLILSMLLNKMAKDEIRARLNEVSCCAFINKVGSVFLNNHNLISESISVLLMGSEAVFHMLLVIKLAAKT